jgi:hypothetical protein
MKRRYYEYYLAASVSLITFLVYLSSLQNAFVYWDDDVYVFRNPHIQSLNADFIRWAFSSFYATNWHPLTWISHAVDYAVWGLNPLGHHLTNNILHAINTFAVVILVARLLMNRRGNRPQDSAAALLSHRAALVAGGVTGFLFGLHPVHVESVAWVSERKDLLCSLFFLLSVILYVNAVRRIEPGAESKRLTLGALLPALCLFVLALLSKPMAVSLPAVLLILDWYPFERIQSQKTLFSALVEKVPFLILSVGLSIVTILAQSSEGGMNLTNQFPLPGRLIVAGKSIIVYLWMMLLPLDLTPFYPYPHKISFLSPGFIIPSLLALGITVLCLFSARKNKLWLAIWSYYMVTLMPVLGIIQVGEQAMADRYTYLPGLGPFLVVGLSAAWLSERGPASPKWRIIKAGSIACAVLMVFSLSYLTVKQIAVWENTEGLWTDVIKKEIEREPEGLYNAYNNRGMFYSDTGQFDKAVDDFDKAIALNPEECMTHYSRGAAYYKEGRLDKAVADFNETIARCPSYWEAYVGRDRALKEMGHPVDKKAH